jgi:hypothetical protein
MMKQRFLTSLVVLAAVTAFVSLAPSPVAGQAPAKGATKATKKAYVPPKTPWGDPDLQGLWPATDLINVPMQRNAKMGTRNVLTDEEYQQQVQRAERTAESDAQVYQPANAKAGINPPAYWLEHGKPQHIASLVVDPPDGRIPPLTEQAKEKQARARQAKQGHGPNESWEDQSLYDRCISRGVMGSILPVIYNNGTQIMQAPGLVAIRYEMIHETRIIPLDGSPHVGKNIRSYMGDARGHWEGNTLVIETTNFLGDKNGIGPNGGGTPHSANMVLIERWTRVAPDMMDYKAIINDPETWTAPWTIEMPLRRDDSFPLYEYACHEGNYAMIDMLSGARADEERAKEKQGSK